MKFLIDDSALRSRPVEKTRSRRAVRLTELLSLVPLQTVHGPRDVSIHGVTADSRNVEEGFLFVAIEGETTDGHLFVDDAVARGAVAIVSERAGGRDRVTWVQTPDARQPRAYCPREPLAIRRRRWISSVSLGLTGRRRRRFSSTGSCHVSTRRPR